MMIKDQKIEEFLEDVASNAPTPGGGAVAAVMGAAAAALVEMVGNVTKNSNKELKRIVKNASEARETLLSLADEDAAAFDAVMAAFKTSKNDPSRKEKIQTAFKGAAETPLKVAVLAKEINGLAREVLRAGNKNAASDAKTAIYLSDAAKKSAIANVEINLIYIKDAKFVTKINKTLATLK